MGGSTAGSRATADLSEQLDALPRGERLAAQARAQVMFAEYLGADEPELVRRRHPWPWFVTRFHGLRVPALAARPRGAAAKSDGNTEVLADWLAQHGEATG
jgi:hypothetical protein